MQEHSYISVWTNFGGAIDFIMDSTLRRPPSLILISIKQQFPLFFPFKNGFCSFSKQTSLMEMLFSRGGQNLSLQTSKAMAGLR